MDTKQPSKISNVHAQKSMVNMLENFSGPTSSKHINNHQKQLFKLKEEQKHNEMALPVFAAKKLEQ